MEHKDKDIDKHNGVNIADDAFYVLPDNDRQDAQNVEDDMVAPSDAGDEASARAAEEGAGTPQPGSPRGRGPLRILLRILVSPVEGWKELRRSALSGDSVAQGCFYPLLALMAAAVFATLFYIPSTSLQTLVVDALILFISYFLGYFCVILVLKTLLPADCREAFDKDFGRELVMMSMSTLSMVQILIELVPFLQPLFVFLPLYTIYLIVKGVKYLRCPAHRETMLMVSVSLLTIGIPPLLQWLLGMMMPAATVG